MTATVNGLDWDVDDVASVTDGDTVRLWRSRTERVSESLSSRTYDDPALVPHGQVVRLAWVDTPERGEVGWGTAKADTAQWLLDHEDDGLHVTVYGDGGFSRLLGDVWYTDAQGQRRSLSQWLMVERGWLPFVG